MLLNSQKTLRNVDTESGMLPILNSTRLDSDLNLYKPQPFDISSYLKAKKNLHIKDFIQYTDKSLIRSDLLDACAGLAEDSEDRCISQASLRQLYQAGSFSKMRTENQVQMLIESYQASRQKRHENYKHHQDGIKRRLNLSTIEEYKTVIKRYKEKELSWDQIIQLFENPGKAISINTWRKDRAALIWYLNNYLMVVMASISHLDQEDRIKVNIHCECMEKLLALDPPALSDRKKKNSKRKILKPLRKIDKQWRHTLISIMPNRQLPLLVLALSGCRPAELVNGVNVELINGKIRFEIFGVKLTHYSGQEVRRFDISVDGTLAEALAALLCTNDNKLKVKIESAKQLTAEIASAGRRAFPTLKGNVSAYCFRHQFAADLKRLATGNEDAQIEISMILGHQSNQTKQYYGYCQQGSGEFKFPENVHATTEVRIKKPSPFLSNKHSFHP
jgi:hypothetical protein